MKKGEAWAICFYLKSRCGWREITEPGAVNVNINGTLAGETAQAERERIAKRRALIRLLTVAKQRQYLELLRKAAERQQEQEREKAAGDRGGAPGGPRGLFARAHLNFTERLWIASG